MTHLQYFNSTLLPNDPTVSHKLLQTNYANSVQDFVLAKNTSKGEFNVQMICTLA